MANGIFKSNFGVLVAALYFGVSVYISYRIFTLGTLYAQLMAVLFFAIVCGNAYRILRAAFKKSGTPSPLSLLSASITHLWRIISHKRIEARLASKNQNQQKRLSSRQHQLFLHNFLQHHPDVLQQYIRIKDSKETLLAINDIADEQKEHAIQSSNAADGVVDDFYSLLLLSGVEGATNQNKEQCRQAALAQLAKINASLDSMIKAHSNQLKFSIDHTYFIRQYEVKAGIDALRNKAHKTLTRLKDCNTTGETALEAIEDIMVVENILNHHLDDVWEAYQRAKQPQGGKNYAQLPQAEGTDLLKLNPASNQIDVDKVMDEILAQIDAYLTKIDNGVSSVKSNKAISKMLENQMYFKARNDTVS